MVHFENGQCHRRAKQEWMDSFCQISNSNNVDEAGRIKQKGDGVTGSLPQGSDGNLEGSVLRKRCSLGKHGKLNAHKRVMSRCTRSREW